MSRKTGICSIIISGSADFFPKSAAMLNATIYCSFSDIKNEAVVSDSLVFYIRIYYLL